MKYNSVCEQYGDYSLASFLIKYQQLVHAVENYVNSNINLGGYEAVKQHKSNVEDHLINTRRNSLYNRSIHRLIHVSNGHEEYEYPRDLFESQYGLQWLNYTNEVHELSTALKDKSLFHKSVYVYAIDTDSRFIIHTQAVPLKDWLFGSTGECLSHPMLVSQNLRAICAGEVVLFFCEKGCIQAAIINNKSGHFCPKPKSLNVVEGILAEKYGVDKRNVISINIHR